MEAAGRELKIRVDLHPALLDITDHALFDYHLVFMHGRNSFHLTDRERAQLKTYVQRGGMILADSICANKAFTESFRREMLAVFPDHAFKRIPADDRPAEHDLRRLRPGRRSRAAIRSRAAKGGRLTVVVRRVPPELEGIKFGERYGVIFSPCDLSCAWRSTNRWNAVATQREDAARIGLNVLLYSLQE